MEVNQKRLEKDFGDLKAFGDLNNGGVTRLAFSAEDLDARVWLKKAMEDAGLEVSQDAFGNMRGRREGIENDLAPVVVGSHIDTVPEGGHFDGTIGVLAGLEAVRTLNDNGIRTRRPIEVINFSAEESSRFGVATMGSKVMIGTLDIDKALGLTDKAGTTLDQALRDGGFDPDNLESAKIQEGSIHAFLEMHIEQGPVLENRKCPIGIVTAIAAPTRFKVKIEGRADHSGNTPMDMRKDALTAACELSLGVERIAAKEAGEKTVGTVGYLHVFPGAMNVVPGRVELGIDIRDISKGDKDTAVQKVIALMDRIARERDISITHEILSDDTPVTLADKVIQTLKDTADTNGIPAILMPSGAGHDAMNMAKITPTGMIFIPCRAGISHNIAEFAAMEDIHKGANLLLKAALTLAEE